MKRRWIILITLCLLWTNHAQANIVLKTMVVNPSKTKTQTALLKAYLPKEVEPENIVELGDLKVNYDIEKSLYYVYKELELKPGESASRSIEMEDVWIISRAELEALIGRAKELVEALKKTAYFDTAISLQKDLEEKSVKVLDRQEQAMDALPQTHIAAYRANAEMFGSMKTGLARLEKMFMTSAVESRAGAETAAGKVSVKATWGVILGVIIILGLISFVFFIIWQRQAGAAALEQKAKKALPDNE